MENWLIDYVPICISRSERIKGHKKNAIYTFTSRYLELHSIESAKILLENFHNLYDGVFM